MNLVTPWDVSTSGDSMEKQSDKRLMELVCCQGSVKLALDHSLEEFQTVGASFRPVVEACVTTCLLRSPALHLPPLFSV